MINVIPNHHSEIGSLHTKETCISILAGYMGIKGIYNFPPLKKKKTEENPARL